VGDNDSLRGVASQTRTGAIAVGTFVDVNAAVPVERNLLERWDGASWTTIAAPNVGATDNALRGAAPIPSTYNVWAVGVRSTSGGPTQTLVLRGT
jgi:hypothetical protein